MTWTYSGLEDVIDDVDEAIGCDGITFEDLRLIDKVVEAVEGMQAQLIPVILCRDKNVIK